MNDTLIIQQGQTPRLTLTQFHPKGSRAAWRIFWLVVAWITLALAFMVPPIIVLTIFLFAATRELQSVACPKCGHSNLVGNRKLNFTCRKCKNLTVIDWAM